MGIVDDLARALYPGQQILRVNGWAGSGSQAGAVAAAG